MAEAKKTCTYMNRRGETCSMPLSVNNKCPNPKHRAGLGFERCATCEDGIRNTSSEGTDCARCKNKIRSKARNEALKAARKKAVATPPEESTPEDEGDSDDDAPEVVFEHPMKGLSRKVIKPPPPVKVEPDTKEAKKDDIPKQWMGMGVQSAIITCKNAIAPLESEDVSETAKFEKICKESLMKRMSEDKDAPPKLHAEEIAEMKRRADPETVEALARRREIERLESKMLPEYQKAFQMIDRAIWGGVRVPPELRGVHVKALEQIRAFVAAKYE